MSGCELINMPNCHCCNRLQTQVSPAQTSAHSLVLLKLMLLASFAACTNGSSSCAKRCRMLLSAAATLTGVGMHAQGAIWLVLLLI